MENENHNQKLNLAFISFVVSGLLLLLLLASFGGDWGTAYGQTAGPTSTPAGESGTPPPTSETSSRPPDITPVVPGLPRSGNPGTVVERNSSIGPGQLGLLAVLSLVLVGSLLVMLQSKRGRVKK